MVWFELKSQALAIMCHGVYIIYLAIRLIKNTPKHIDLWECSSVWVKNRSASSTATQDKEWTAVMNKIFCPIEVKKWPELCSDHTRQSRASCRVKVRTSGWGLQTVSGSCGSDLWPLSCWLLVILIKNKSLFCFFTIVVQDTYCWT